MNGPLLTTERLELWQPQIGDLADLFDLTLAEETRRYLGSFVPTEMDSFARLLRNAGSWSLYGYGTFAVRLKGQQQIIATCGVFRSHRGFGAEQGLDNVPEAGWIIHKDHWGQGYAGEAMTAVMPWFDRVHGKQRVACMIEEGHAVSERLAAKLGFVEYARHQQPDKKPLVLYERLPLA